MTKQASYFATCAKGLEPLLFDELQQLGGSDVRQTIAGCSFQADTLAAYRICMWTRLASRVLLLLGQHHIDEAQDIVKAVSAFAWEEHMQPEAAMIVDFSGSHPAIRHTRFGAQLVKDGVVDRFREVAGKRPNVSRDDPDIRITARLSKDILTWYLDLSGESLHRRGYRLRKGLAPLRETLAAAIAIRSGISADTDTAVADLFCGSGTLLLESAMIRYQRAPGLRRQHWGFHHWLQHDQSLWQQIQTEAETAFEQAKAELSTHFYGYDVDADMLAIAQENADRLELADAFTWQQADATEVTAPAEQGVMISNPPYGERLGEEIETLLLYRRLGQNIRAHFQNWQLNILAGDESLLKRLKLRSHKKYKLYNGALDVVLALYDMTKEQAEFTESKSDDISNRLKKNYKKLEKWAAQEGVSCWRLYDADLPEYNAAVDVYNDYLMIQEYAAPDDIPPAVAKDRLWHLIDSLHQVLPFAANKMTLKVRQRQSGKQQYEKQEQLNWTTIVNEYDAQFEVNLTDYLDAGLFLDHRWVRRELAKNSKGKSVLNLFAYTCTASVHAALAGAKEVISVDLSRTYLEWGTRNFALNNLRQAEFQMIQADCVQWLRDQPPQQRFDLIFLDPPTFSNSKRMEDSFDVQRDHVQLLKLAARLLTDGGMVFFSNNRRKFKLDEEGLASIGLIAEDCTKASIPPDFARNKGIHHFYKVRFLD